jgi:indolepyruvate ferredoxin oxidoreductase alpha subunit
MTQQQVTETVLLMGNEAIARGAIEAGVKLATGYPGTPSSEVIGSLLPVAKKHSIRVEWATNEKVALETAAGVASTGLRALVTMKNAGLNVAADALLSIAYSGVDGGLVIYVADDPACHSGMEEQDSRLYASLSLLPMLELTNPQEAKDTTVTAFELSEKLNLPILIRSTTRVAHSSANVRLGPIQVVDRRPVFAKDIRRHTRASPLWCNEQHTRLIRKVEESKPIFEKLRMNQLFMDGREEYGVIASGVAWNYLMEEVGKFSLTNIALLKIGTVNPLPDNMIRSLLQSRKAVLVLEELEPYVELNVRAIASTLAAKTVIHGKNDATTPRVGEFTHEIVRKALGDLIGRDLITHQVQKETNQDVPVAPARSLQFCPGCPHMGTYLAINRAFSKLRMGKDDAIVTGDIGCTILGMNKPFETCWTEVCMGASISMAAGFRYAGIEKPILATIGDSTFFHAGLPALVNLALTDTRVVVVVLDNRITAMTGHQPSPSTPQATGDPKEPAIKIEEVARAIGIRFVRVVDPFDLKETSEAIVEAIKFSGPSVVVSRRMCSLEARRRGIVEEVASIDSEKCNGCLACVKLLGCPALNVDSNGKVVIDSQQCQGCTLCAGVCPYNAVTPGEWSY